jgi:hypothetical protein
MSRHSPHRAPLFFLPFLFAFACSREPVVSDSGPANEQRASDGGASSSSSDAAAPALAVGSKLGPNDVSILWPIPEEGELPAGYLKVFPKAGERGPGFPIEQADVFGDLHGDLPSALVRSTLAVIALRIDPCSANACAKELRLSAETISPALSDAAMHLIYKLDDAAFNALIGELDVWRTHSPVVTGTRLSVHPGLEVAGISSPFAKELHDIVIRYAKESALVRVTVNSFAMDNWGFRQFDKLAAGWTQTAIPNLPPADSMTQGWLRRAMVESTTDPSGAISPEPTTKSMAALHKADALANGPTNADVLAARDAINHYENPLTSHAANTDCASCHMANQTHRWAEKNGVSFAANTPNRYSPSSEITIAITPPEMNGNLGSTLAFGHHRTNHEKSFPEISTRVAHETLEVLKILNTNR